MPLPTPPGGCCDGRVVVAEVKHGVTPESGADIKKMHVDRDWNKIKDLLPSVIDGIHIPEEDVPELLRLLNAGFTAPENKDLIIQRLGPDSAMSVQSYYAQCAAYISTIPCEDPGYLDIFKDGKVPKSLQLFEGAQKALIAADLPGAMKAWTSLMRSTWDPINCIRDCDSILKTAQESFQYFTEQINSAQLDRK